MSKETLAEMKEAKEMVVVDAENLGKQPVGIEQYDKEGNEIYEPIFKKYRYIQDAAFKFRSTKDFVLWQRDMLRCYADSFLVDEVLAGGKVYVVCTDHKWAERKKGKGKLKATVKVLAETTDELLDEHSIVLHKVPEVSVHSIIDAYVILLELGLNGFYADDLPEGATHALDKFADMTGNYEVVEATREFVEEIQKIRKEAEEKTKQEE